MVLNVIENAKKNAATNSAYRYKEAVNKYYIKKESSTNNFNLDGNFTINNGGAISQEEKIHQIAISGKKPTGGYLVINKGETNNGCIEIDGYAVTMKDGKMIDTVKGKCKDPNAPQIVDIFPQVEDKNPGIICGDGLDEAYDSSGICYIYSVEDLVAFSNMVNSGKNFSGKKVMLMNNLDIQAPQSYVNSKTTVFGDVDKNETTQTLIEELTNKEGKGFNPIGSSSSIAFSGTFEGNTHVINNIYINYSNRDYVGLFGYNTGTIKGIKLTNIEVKGSDGVGGLAGYNSGTITSTIVEGNINSTSELGLAVGYTADGVIETVTKGNVIGTSESVGGIAGSLRSSGKINAIYQVGEISGKSSGGYVNKIVGHQYSGTITAVSLDTATVNGKTSTSTSLSNLNEKSYSASALLTSTPYEEVGFNFTDTNVSTNEYIWYFDNGILTFRHN